jgi:arylsulfatase A-like enzyme
LAEVFRGRGYATGGFVGNTKYAARGTGLERGFSHYEDFPWTFGELIRHSIFVRLFEQKGGRFTVLGIYDDLGRKPAPAVTDGFLAWTDRLDGQPFFAFLNYFDAHSPYLPDRHPVEERALTPEEKTRLRGWLTADRDTLHRETEFAHGCFLELVRQLDQELERLFLELDARGLRENTLVIVTSDHGEQFGEHDLFNHGNSLYRPLVHVPLIVNWPAGISERVDVDRAVSLTDLGATLADALSWPNADRLPGRSFWHPQSKRRGTGGSGCAVRLDRASARPPVPLRAGRRRFDVRRVAQRLVFHPPRRRHRASLRLPTRPRMNSTIWHPTPPLRPPSRNCANFSTA